MEIRVWRFQNYRDCGYTCNPHKFEIPALRFPRRPPVIPCKHLQCGFQKLNVWCWGCWYQHQRFNCRPEWSFASKEPWKPLKMPIKPILKLHWRSQTKIWNLYLILLASQGPCLKKLSQSRMGDPTESEICPETLRRFRTLNNLHDIVQSCLTSRIVNNKIKTFIW